MKYIHNIDKQIKIMEGALDYFKNVCDTESYGDIAYEDYSDYDELKSLDSEVFEAVREYDMYA